MATETSPLLPRAEEEEAQDGQPEPTKSWFTRHFEHVFLTILLAAVVALVLIFALRSSSPPPSPHICSYPHKPLSPIPVTLANCRLTLYNRQPYKKAGLKVRHVSYPRMCARRVRNPV
jgi:hypothetical protein